jgi:DNA-binding MarR family transcriptional regulator
MRFDEADALLDAIRTIAIRHRALAAVLLAPLDLYPGQEVILLDLAAHGPRTQIQLATAVGCEPPTITNSVRKLESAGLVARQPSPSDARVSIVELTDGGRDLLPSLKATWKVLAERTVAAMATPVPLEQLTATLTDLARSITEAEQSGRRSRRRTSPSDLGIRANA